MATVNDTPQFRTWWIMLNGKNVGQVHYLAYYSYDEVREKLIKRHNFPSDVKIYQPKINEVWIPAR